MRRLRITLAIFTGMCVVFSSCNKPTEYRYNATYQVIDRDGVGSHHYVYDYMLDDYELGQLKVSDSIIMKEFDPNTYNFNVVLQSINGEQITDKI